MTARLLDALGRVGAAHAEATENLARLGELRNGVIRRATEAGVDPVVISEITGLSEDELDKINEGVF